MTAPTDGVQAKILECPCCGASLAQAYARANYGRVLLLDQCPGCGGVWELYFSSEDSLRSLGAVDTGKLMAAHACIGVNGKCPHCQVELTPFVDPGLPKDASIRRCAACSGLWLNRGELARYADFKASIKNRAALEPKGAGIEALRKLQKELDAATINKERAPDAGAAAPLNGKEFATDVGFLILETLARLLFPF